MAIKNNRDRSRLEGLRQQTPGIRISKILDPNGVLGIPDTQGEEEQDTRGPLAGTPTYGQSARQFGAGGGVNRDMSSEEGYWQDVYPGAFGQTVAGATGVPPRVANQSDPNKATSAAGSPQKPIFGTDTNGDGRITGDEINAQYRLGRGRGGLTGLRLGSMMAQKYTNPYAQLGAVIGATLRGIFDPEAAGRMEYEEDVQEYYAETEANLKLKAQEAAIAQKQARTEFTAVQTQFRSMQVSNLQNQQEMDNLFARTGHNISVLNNNSDYITSADRQEAEKTLRADLRLYYQHIGMDPGEVDSMSTAEVQQNVSQMMIDPKSTPTAVGFFYYRRNRAGQMVMVEDNGSPVTTTNFHQFLMNQVNAGLKKMEGVDQLTAEESLSFYSRAEDMVRKSPEGLRLGRNGAISPNDKERIKRVYDALVREHLANKHKDRKEFQRILVPTPDGGFIERDLNSVLGKEETAAPGQTPAGQTPQAPTITQASVGLNNQLWNQHSAVLTGGNVGTIATNYASMPATRANAAVRTAYAKAYKQLTGVDLTDDMARIQGNVSYDTSALSSATSLAQLEALGGNILRDSETELEAISKNPNNQFFKDRAAKVMAYRKAWEQKVRELVGPKAETVSLKVGDSAFSVDFRVGEGNNTEVVSMPGQGRVPSRRNPRQMVNVVVRPAGLYSKLEGTDMGAKLSGYLTAAVTETQSRRGDINNINVNFPEDMLSSNPELAGYRLVRKQGVWYVVRLVN